MKKLILLMFVLMIPMIAANPAFYFKQNQTTDLLVPVYDDDKAPATTSIVCNISVRYPNSTFLVQNQNMTYNDGGIYNYTLTNLLVNGEYPTSIACDDGSLYGFSTFTFEVNYLGNKATGQKTTSIAIAIIILFGVAFLLFLGYLFTPKEKTPYRWSFFLLSLLFIVIAINITSLFIRDESASSGIRNIFDQIGAACYILYWFIGGLFLIIWILTAIANIGNRQNIRRAEMIGSESNNPQW